MREIPPVFVISPPEMEGRHKACLEHLRKIGIEPILPRALYTDHVKFVSKYNRPNRVYQNLSGGSICNALNHWRIWQHIALSGIEAAIIFEDDVSLPSDFLDKFENAMGYLPSDWDIFYLSLAYPANIRKGKIRVEHVEGSVWRHIAATTWDGACDGQYAYMVSGEGARKMVPLPFDLNEPIDRWLSFNLLPFLNGYIWHPSPISQKSGKEWKSSCDHLSVKKMAANAQKRKEQRVKE